MSGRDGIGDRGHGSDPGRDRGPGGAPRPSRRTAPDPLGKRALFWVPAPPDPPAGGRGRSGGRGGSKASGAGGPGPVPLGRRALFSDAVAGPDDARTEASDNPVTGQGPITVTCGTCGAVSRVGLLDFAIFQLPVGVWLPGRRFDHRMTCPACRKRAWTSVTVRPR